MLEKLASYLITLWLVATITFFLMKLIPGDPFTDEQALPKEIHTALKKHYGLTDPWYTQYGRYLLSVATFDFGPSFKYKDRSVNDIIKEGFPVSLILAIQTIALSLSLGITLGSFAAFFQSKWQDYFILVSASIAVSVPSFVIAACLQYFFALKLGWLPVARWGSFAQSILPMLSLAALPSAFIARLTRSNLIDVIKQKYVIVARAKGLQESVILFKHALRNAILPVFSYLGILTTNILVGSFIIEKIFGIPGLGRWFVLSVMDRDYPVIMGLTIFYSIILLSITTFIDLSYAWLDPRMHKQKEKACAS